MHQPDQFTMWQRQFEAERLRILEALGELTAGGIVEGLQPIGATSVPGMLAAPCVDIGLAVWPFPLEARQQTKLEALGYLPVTGYEGAPEQRFRHAAGDSQLFLAEPGSDEWTNYLLMRDYLRSAESARQTFSRFKQSHRAGTPEYQQVKGRLFSETIAAAQAWWISTQGFAPVEAVALELKQFEHPWHIASGWAIDLFMGRVTRVHHDVDVVIARTDQLALQHCLAQRGWKLLTPFEGRQEPWPPHMLLEPPRHQVHAHRDEAFIDCLLSDLSNGLWHYRRDPAVVRQLDRAVLRTAHGIPFLAPELVLLFKSKNTSFNKRERSQDRIDFDLVHTHLEAERRAWLRWALLATEPEHPWIEQLR
jgi:GrpB-like predicted nucleotidyltransferase (UPF0157 family)